MIKNMIFDMMGVVIRFDTEKYYNDHGIGITDRKLLNTIIGFFAHMTREIS